MASSVLPAAAMSVSVSPAQSALSSAPETPSSVPNSASVSASAPSAAIASAKYAESGEMTGFSASSFAASAASSAAKFATAAAFPVSPCAAAGSRFAVRFMVTGLEFPCDPGAGGSAAQPQKSSAHARQSARHARRFGFLCFMLQFLLVVPVILETREGRIRFHAPLAIPTEQPGAQRVRAPRPAFLCGSARAANGISSIVSSKRCIGR